MTKNEIPATPAPSPEPFVEGDLLEITRKIDDPCYGNFRKGARFTVEEYLPADGENTVPLYLGSKPGNYNDVMVPADSVRLVKSAQQMHARVVPTREELVRTLGSELLVSANGFTINQTVHNTEGGTIECSGETEAGLPFAFTVTIGSAYKVDF